MEDFGGHAIADDGDVVGLGRHGNWGLMCGLERIV